MSTSQLARSAASALTLAVAIAFGGLHSRAHAQVSPAVAEDLMHKSGLWEQLGSIEAGVQAGVDAAAARGGAGMSPADRQRLARAIADAYAAPRMRSVAAATIAQRMRPADVEAILAWSDSPEGKSIAAAEEAAAARPGDPQERMAAGTALFETLPASRQALIKRLVSVTRAAEVMTDLGVNSAVGIQQGLAAAHPGTPVPSAEQFRAMLDMRRPQMLKAYATASLGLYASAYASVDDQTLARYVAFLDGSVGSTYNEIGLAAIDRAFVDASQTFGRLLPMPAAQAASQPTGPSSP